MNHKYVESNKTKKNSINSRDKNNRTKKLILHYC